MEYQKDFGDKFSIGYGTMKTAGSGDLSQSREIPKSMKYRHDRREILVAAGKAALLTTVAVLNFSCKRKKKKK
ncbi:MAG: hypothetical protein J5501_08900 [Ruminococcus sp.]|nr:hypothetical protein [Ruminococcus sp.]